MKIEDVKLEEIRKLRHTVLREGKPFSTTAYDKDKDKTTFHLACVYKNKIITCATFYPESLSQIISENPFRLRGMGTEKKFRRRGYGKKLMVEAFKHLKTKKSDLLWCNARLVAVDFYKSMGFDIKGDMFEIEGIGKHYLMYRNL